MCSSKLLEFSIGPRSLSYRSWGRGEASKNTVPFTLVNAFGINCRRYRQGCLPRRRPSPRRVLNWGAIRFRSKTWGRLVAGIRSSGESHAGPQKKARAVGRMTFGRITVDSAVMGRPSIRGMRASGHRVAMVAHGVTVEEILADLSCLEAEDIAESLRYSAEAVRERELPLTRPA